MPKHKSLPVLSPLAAKEQGYQPITNSIYPSTEAAIVQSIETSMQGIDAVWIDYGSKIELGRKIAEIKVVEHPLLTEE